ncbi:MAG: phenylalanine--tRNA ligase beta subunit-related protein [Anaerolineae bacterium]
MTTFQYHPEVLAKYPKVVGGVIVARGLVNAETPEALKTEYATEQQATITRIGSMPLSELPSLSAWRGVFRGFGVDPTQYRNAAEALLRRLTKQGDIPFINTMVDLANLVSIRYALPVAVFDTQDTTGAVTVRLARGDERFTVLGQSDPEHPEAGEVIFVDEADLVSARRWCWRQSAQSAANETTSNVIVTVEAHHSNARPEIEAALHNLSALLERYAGAEADSMNIAILDAANPAI